MNDYNEHVEKHRRKATPTIRDVLNYQLSDDVLPKHTASNGVKDIAWFPDEYARTNWACIDESDRTSCITTIRIPQRSRI